MLRADSKHPLPDSDKDVVAALHAYGVVFNKVKKYAAERLDLLACLMWVHAHQRYLHAVWPAASVAQHRTLAKALRLDYDTHAAFAPWLTMVVRKVLSCSVPGSTPQKRQAPYSSADGQIIVPGNSAGAPAVPPPRKKPRKSKAPAKSKRDSSGDGSSSSSDGDEPATQVVDLSSPAPLACMPTNLERGPAFDDLVAARCRRSWLATATFESKVPVAYRAHLFRGKM